MSLLEIVNLIFIYVVAITIHEYSHAFAAHQLGDPTAKEEGRLTLNPMAHIDPLTTLALPVLLILAGSPVIFGAARPVPFTPYMVRGGKKGAALIALAGPASNLVLAAIIALVIRLVPSLALAGSGLLISMMTVNIALALFNLLPIPPLDGSRILYAFVPSNMQDVMERFERTGPIIILVLFLVGYPFIAPYLGTATQVITRFLLGM
ncbi:site-2 protease family protein [bacterium]|nr:MAG: site-2 protease family protein [bacterium]